MHALFILAGITFAALFRNSFPYYSTPRRQSLCEMIDGRKVFFASRTRSFKMQFSGSLFQLPFGSAIILSRVLCACQFRASNPFVCRRGVDVDRQSMWALRIAPSRLVPAANNLTPA